jgi:hypothetical protein
MLHAQRTTDWWAFGGDSQRDGWGKNEQSFTKDDVKNFRLLWQQKLDNSTQGSKAQTGVGALLPPVVLGRLIGYRGFKELAFVAGSNNKLWAIDADLNRLYWVEGFDVGMEKKKSKTKGEHACNDSLTSAPALLGPLVFHTVAPGAKPAGRYASPSIRFSRPQPVFLLTGDGKLRQLNQSDGTDVTKPLPFVPAGAKAQALNISDETILTTTHEACGQDAAVWSIDTADDSPKAKSFKLGADVAGMGGVALGSDGTVYVQTESGPLDPDIGKFGGVLLALTKDLTVSSYFVLPPAEGKASAPNMNSTSPLVISVKNEDFVVTANKDGRLYVLKGSSVGSDDHHHYASRSPVLPRLDGNKSHGIWGALSSWQDTDGTRYVLAPVWGPLSDELLAAIPGTKAPNGSIVALKVVVDNTGAPTLQPAWVSRDLDSPVPPVIAKGIVFALSNGKFNDKDEPRRGTHATLYAFDGVTGQELYSTKDQVNTAGNLTGLTVVNGRVYFSTVDNTVQVFGKYLEP